ncbi:MAG: siphovirus Gp157 family protein [Pseudomonadota bacterium]
MTAADKIAADLRDAFRRIELPGGNPRVAEARYAIQSAYQANDFDAGLTRALAAIVALDDAEAAAAAEVRAAQARMATVTEASAKAREALRQALDACGGPGAAEAETEHHKAQLQRGGAKVEITDPDALSEIYWRYKKEPDKALIKAIMAKGEAIAGAALVQSPPTLRISAKDKS